MGEVTNERYCPRCEGTFADGRTCPRDGNRLVRLSGQLDPLVGRDLDGRFTVLEKLGQGGMGAVYRARQHSVEREVAVKVVHANLTSDAEAIKRFLREAKLSSLLSHPNAVGVLDFGQTSDGIFFLVMELVGGRTLDAELKELGTLAPARLVRIGMQVCDALEAAHALSIVHRDLKPSNIMLSGRDFVKVLDFGLAKLMATEGDPSEADASLLGTPAYMPPERIGGAAADARGDLYSLGCTLFLAGSGRFPYRAGSLGAAMSPSLRAPAAMTGVPEPLARVIDRLVAFDPAERYQTAAAARQALEDVGLTTEVRTSTAFSSTRPPTDTVTDAASEQILVEPRPRTRRRYRRQWAGGVGAAVAIAILGFAAATQDRAPRGLAGASEPLPPPPPVRVVPAPLPPTPVPRTLTPVESPVTLQPAPVRLPPPPRRKPRTAAAKPGVPKSGSARPAAPASPPAKPSTPTRREPRMPF